MKTRTKKSVSAVNTSETKEKPKRKALSDKTNNANTSNNMKRKKSEKPASVVTNRIETRQTQKNSVKSVKTNQNDQTDVIERRRSSRLSINKTATDPNKKNKRLLDSLKSPSPENSDPYEFKFDPKKEPKRKPKKRDKRKKYFTASGTSSDTSYDEDNSMKPIVKRIRKKVNNICVTPVQRQLRNRLVKIDKQVPQIPLKINIVKNAKVVEIESASKDLSVINKIAKTNLINSVEIPASKDTSLVHKIVKRVPQIPHKSVKIPPVVNKIANITYNVEIPASKDAKTNINSVEIPVSAKVVEKPASKDQSAVDEVNEIANTFLEEDDSDVLISSSSRIDIISNLIVRKSVTQPPANVFNSTMIHKTPQQVAAGAQSPWRVDVSTIPRKCHNFSVKNKSFTPSYTPDVTDNKIQTTLLGFVNRTTPKDNLQITLFETSPPRKPFENLSNSISPIRSNRSNKQSDDSLFGFSVLSDSEDKENSPVFSKIANKKKVKLPEKKMKECAVTSVKTNEPVVDDVCDSDVVNALFEDLDDVKKNKKRYSRQYTRPQTKRKRNVSFKICSDDSESETETHQPKKKQKDVLTKEEAKEADRLASHYNSYFEEVENYPLCFE